jgi:hypothetical protein
MKYYTLIYSRYKASILYFNYLYIKDILGINTPITSRDIGAPFNLIVIDLTFSTDTIIIVALEACF